MGSFELQKTPFRSRSHPTLPIRIGALIYKPDDDAADVDEQPISKGGEATYTVIKKSLRWLAIDQASSGLSLR